MCSLLARPRNAAGSGVAVRARVSPSKAAPCKRVASRFDVNPFAGGPRR